ncbi:MAG: hypothetical protein A3J51_06460 [Omnitrophica WOR_2 bacterium RIFCSPHIGHO2_02_FULL_45_21]|nr:MAG: hypothetical protein A3J51_06460 [Omnitrophica WOR_2 bacterium RIFCSPHIGHO2_02_FULL_45_21]
MIIYAISYLNMNKFVDKIAKWLSSIKTAVIILSLVILASASGTFIPQGLADYEYMRRFNQPAYHLLRFFGFTDIYHSWWFIVLLILLWCSIFICTLKRLKFNPSTQLPTVITHLGLLIILAGALVTRILGEKGFMIIYEKHNQDTYIDTDNKFKTLNFKIYLDDFSLKDFRSKVVIHKQAQEILRETIEVNRPLSYQGYSFYQASYGRDNFNGMGKYKALSQPLKLAESLGRRPVSWWTGLEVVRDPGVPFVWCGFILLNLGIILRFYFRPNALYLKRYIDN